MANPHHPDSPWTDERVRELLRLRGRGWSAAEIAKELAHPRISRSAVLGRLNRMGLAIGKPRPPTLSKHVEAERSRKRRVREKEAKMSRSPSGDPGVPAEAQATGRRSRDGDQRDVLAADRLELPLAAVQRPRADQREIVLRRSIDRWRTILPGAQRASVPEEYAPMIPILRCEHCGQVIPPKRLFAHQPVKRRIFDFVAKHPEGVSRDQILDAVYGHRSDGGPESGSIVSGHLNKMRAVMRAAGVDIISPRGRGASYRLVAL